MYRRPFPEVAELISDHKAISASVNNDRREEELLSESTYTSRSSNTSPPLLFLIMKRAQIGEITREEAEIQISKLTGKG